MGWNYLSIPKLQRLHRWSLGMDKYFHPTLYNGCNYLSMLGLKLNHVSKWGSKSAKWDNFDWTRATLNILMQSLKYKAPCITRTSVPVVCISRTNWSLAPMKKGSNNLSHLNFDKYFVFRNIQSTKRLNHLLAGALSTLAMCPCFPWFKLSRNRGSMAASFR